MKKTTTILATLGVVIAFGLSSVNEAVAEESYKVCYKGSCAYAPGQHANTLRNWRARDEEAERLSPIPIANCIKYIQGVEAHRDAVYSYIKLGLADNREEAEAIANERYAREALALTETRTASELKSFLKNGGC